MNRSAEDGVNKLPSFVLVSYNQQTSRPSWVSNKIFPEIFKAGVKASRCLTPELAVTANFLSKFYLHMLKYIYYILKK